MLTERLFANREELTAALRDECVAAIKAALDAQGEASFMVSGGSSPELLYKSLSQVDLPWESIYVALVDERWVDFNHEKSNEAFVARTLVQNKAANTHLVGMKNSAERAVDGLADCESAYQQLAQPFAITILGMGADGHTASFFPHAEGLTAALDPHNEELCAAISAHPSEATGPITERMTLTLTGLMRSRSLIMLITGQDKLKVFRAAQAGTDTHEMPVRALLQQQQVPVTLYWAP